MNLTKRRKVFTLMLVLVACVFGTVVEAQGSARKSSLPIKRLANWWPRSPRRPPNWKCTVCGTTKNASLYDVVK